MERQLYRDRTEAGEFLATLLARENLKDPVVLALPRGGVPLGAIVARKLDAPLDVILVRKIGVPGNEEVAAGAVVDGSPPVLVFNDDVMRFRHLTEDSLSDTITRKIAEIDTRRSLYRAGTPPLPVKGKTVIIVDDGIATGATAKAAIKGLRKQQPARIILAVPVAPREVLEQIAPDVDEIICPLVPYPFYAVGAHYRNFGQTSDAEVIETLAEFRNKPKAG